MPRVRAQAIDPDQRMALCGGYFWSMIRKSGNRFSEKIMLKQRDEIMMRFRLIAS
jgi:hypothetical protein